MSHYLTMPRLGETMEEGTLSKWLVAPGQAFKRGETIAEIETDKTLVEFPALEDGEIVAYLVAEGDVVPVGGKLAELAGEEREVRDETADALPSAEAAAPPPRPEISRATGGKVAASPAARRLAQKSGIDLTDVSGSGRRGRVQADDVRNAAQAAPAENAEQLYAKVLGPATEEAVVFLHGFAGDADAWINIQLPLARDILTLAFDLPGHARSRSHPGSDGVMAMAAAVIEALEQRGLTKVHLVGHSMGGAVAASIALQARERVKSMTLLAPAGLGPDLNHRLLRRLAEIRDLESITVLLEQLIGWGSRLPKGMAELVAEQREDPAVTAKYQEILTSLVEGESQAVLPMDQVNALPIPTRLVWGSRDWVVPIEQAAIFWAARLHRFEGVGHLPHLEIPQEVIALIRQTYSESAGAKSEV